MENQCYLVWDETTRRCAVIDPGYTGEAIAAHLKEQGLSLAMILLTHAHYDHIGGVEALRAGTGAPVYLHPLDAAMPLSMSHMPVFYTDTYMDGQIISLDSVDFHVLHTPGHSAGSVCLLAGDCLFTGDTLFQGSCGRTDFPTGSPEQMRASLARLASLPGNLRVLPGHGPASTLDFERSRNPYIREAVKG